GVVFYSLLQQGAGRPNDRNAKKRRAEADAAQFRWILARRRRHALSHRLCKARHQQSLDREDEPDRRAKVAHFSPPSPPATVRSQLPAAAWGSKSSGRNPTSG